jgi:Flp pilus assembly protein TadB
MKVVNPQKKLTMNGSRENGCSSERRGWRTQRARQRANTDTTMERAKRELQRRLTTGIKAQEKHKRVPLAWICVLRGQAVVCLALLLVCLLVAAAVVVPCVLVVPPARRQVIVLHLALAGYQAHATVAELAAALYDVVKLGQARDHGVEALGIGDHGIGGAALGQVLIRDGAH